MSYFVIRMDQNLTRAQNPYHEFLSIRFDFWYSAFREWSVFKHCADHLHLLYWMYSPPYATILLNIIPFVEKHHVDFQTALFLISSQFSWNTLIQICHCTSLNGGIKENCILTSNNKIISKAICDGSYATVAFNSSLTTSVSGRRRCSFMTKELLREKFCKPI